MYDAAAYSGVQIAARDLNYIAYTNRAMIANEIVVGHMVSYQAEVDVLMGIVSNPTGPLGLMLNWLSALGIPLGNGVMQAFESVREASEILSGIYILQVSANTKLYSNFQMQVVNALTQEQGGEHPIISVMNDVAQHYAQRPGISIDVNDPIYLSQLSSGALDGVDTADPYQAEYIEGLEEKAERAADMPEMICGMVLFARPEVAVGNGNGNGNGAGNGVCNSGNSNALGGSDNPMRDGGDFVSLITRTMEGLAMADWIENRDAEYGNFLTWNVSRTGSTQMQWVGNGNNG